MNTIEFLTLSGKLSNKPTLIGLEFTGTEVDKIVNGEDTFGTYTKKVFAKVLESLNAGTISFKDGGTLDLTEEVLTDELMEIIGQTTDKIVGPNGTPFQRGFYFSQLLDHATDNLGAIIKYKLVEAGY